jgi:hypothetical protein
MVWCAIVPGLAPKATFHGCSAAYHVVLRIQTTATQRMPPPPQTNGLYLNCSRADRLPVELQSRRPAAKVHRILAKSGVEVRTERSANRSSSRLAGTGPMSHSRHVGRYPTSCRQSPCLETRMPHPNALWPRSASRRWCPEFAAASTLWIRCSPPFRPRARRKARGAAPSPELDSSATCFES